MIQTVIALSLLTIAVAFMGWKYVGKKLVKPSKKDSCGPDCNCS